MQRSLVTGACGFLGSHVVDVLAEAGHEVRATDLPDACEADDRARGRFPSFVRTRAAELRPADLTQPASLDGLFEGVTYVFHVAAVFSYSAPWELLHRVNVEGTRNLCEAALGAGVQRILAWGAGGIYGIPTPERLPFTETSEVRPPNAYQRSKWEQEQVLAHYHRERGLSYAALRPVTPYGARAVYGGGQLVMDVARMRHAVVPSNFRFRIPFAHARDVARAALHLATHPAADGEAYNMVDDIPLATVDYIKFIATCMGREARVIPPVPLGLVRGALRLASVFGLFERDLAAYFGRDFAYDNTKLKATGFEFLYPDPRPGLAETVTWYRDQGWL